MDKLTCPSCGKTKTVDNFTKSKTTKTGYQKLCKPCWSKKYNGKNYGKKAHSKKGDIEGSLVIDPFSREKLLEQVGFICEGQSEKTNNGIKLDYSFLNKLK